jgi:O-acetyl-ADP-ribose deacetylase (regulator of RNase III)
MAVDAIVNAANPIMLGGGGVDKAIHGAAGPRLREACRDVWASDEMGAGPGLKLQQGVRCPTGEVRPTPGFDLPAKWVLHTVGPVWPSDATAARFAVNDPISALAGNQMKFGVHEIPAEDEARQLLRECYKKSALIALGMGLKSIAFPALSTGVYGCPMKTCAEVALKWASDYRDWPIDVTFAIWPQNPLIDQRQMWLDAYQSIFRVTYIED